MIDIHQKGETGINVRVDCLHCPVHFFLFICLAVPKPGSEAWCLIGPSLIGPLMCVDDVLSTYIMLAYSNCSEFTQAVV